MKKKMKTYKDYKQGIIISVIGLTATLIAIIAALFNSNVKTIQDVFYESRIVIILTLTIFIPLLIRSLSGLKKLNNDTSVLE